RTQLLYPAELRGRACGRARQKRGRGQPPRRPSILCKLERAAARSAFAGPVFAAMWAGRGPTFQPSIRTGHRLTPGTKMHGRGRQGRREMARRYANSWSRAAARLTGVAHTQAPIFRWGVLLALVAVWIGLGLVFWLHLGIWEALYRTIAAVSM